MHPMFEYCFFNRPSRKLYVLNMFSAWGCLPFCCTLRCCVTGSISSRSIRSANHIWKLNKKVLLIQVYCINKLPGQLKRHLELVFLFLKCHPFFFHSEWWQGQHAPRRGSWALSFSSVVILIACLRLNDLNHSRLF